ncbi:MAG: hypothetical protein QM737_06375 [Ferruginibacter sp.]
MKSIHQGPAAGQTSVISQPTATINNKSAQQNNKPALFMRWILALLLFVSVGAGAQTTLINPATDGGFESGFGAWTVVNGANNQWFTGTAAGAAVGTRAAFIGSNATTYTDGVSQASAAVDFFYMDIAFPSGQTNIQLTFSYKQPTLDATFDNMKVFLVPTSTTLTAGTELSSGQVGITEYPAAALANFTAQTAISLPGSAAGTTQRLVFQWKNDNASPYGSGAIDNISLTSAVPATYTWNQTAAASFATAAN